MTAPNLGLQDSVPIPEDTGPPSEKLTPMEWARSRLFSTASNGIITVVLGAIAIYGAYRLARFVLVTGRWDPVAKNLELFMIGGFPRDERWRIVGQLLVMALGVGFILGNLRAARRDFAAETEQPFVTESWRTYAGSYWSVALFFGITILAFVRTISPVAITLAAIALAVAGWAITGRLPGHLRPLGWTLAALAIVVSFQLLSGTGGWAWLFTTLALIPAVNDAIGRLSVERIESIAPIAVGLGVLVGIAAIVLQPNVLGLLGLAVAGYGVWMWRRGDLFDATRLGVLMIVAALVVGVYRLIDLGGIDWKDWGGLQLNLVATTLAIVLAFPIGILLALGRRSSLPALRIMSVAYIEFFRGAPLITFLLAAQFFLGFFLNTSTPLSLITRAIAAVTLFSAAYIAEIVRGGLQAVPSGQVEAGLASGLSQAKITRLIVMPQALRAVIPAMVGQFISLFKDTSLFAIISISEFLDVRALVHTQAEFRGFGIAETLTFVAFGFWAFSFAMSRESQRLERRLDVGAR